jgi:chromatin remodeling complex protein RSC6
MSETENHESAQNDNEDHFDEKVNTLILKSEAMYKDIKTVVLELKNLKKEHLKIVKKVAGRRKKVPKDPNAPKKEPSGFAKPTIISSELASFLGLNPSELIARPQAIKRVSTYIKEHKLQDEKDGRKIHLNRKGGEVLAELLKVPVDTELTYFNLQSYMKNHFPKVEKTEVKKVKKVKEDKVKEDKVSKKKVEEPPKEEPKLTKTRRSSTKSKKTEVEASA